MYKVLFYILFLFYVSACAQDNNYWNMQFGAKSSLLGGAVVGGYADNGTMYYNPGALNFKDSANINVSANLYKVERMTVKNALGKGINIRSYNFDVTPQLISGTRKLTKHVEIGAVFLTHNDVDISFQQSHSDVLSIYPKDSVFKRDYIGDFDYRNRISEQWFGLCMAFSINNKLAVGFTHFFTYRFQRFSQHISATAVSKDTINSKGYTTEYDYGRDVRYDLLNTLAKFGIVYKPNNKLHLGLTLTAPSLYLFGRAKTYTKIYSSNLAYNNYDNYTVFDRQKGLFVDYQTPFSVSLGAKLSLAKFKLYGTVEYFAPISTYDVINPQDSLNVNKSGVEYNSSNLLGVQYSAKQVLNGAVGLEWNAFNVLSLLASYRTDYNTQKDKIKSTDNNSLVTSYMDLYHFTLGCIVKRSKKSIMLGVSYSYGKLLNQKQFANFRYPTDNSNLLGDSENQANYYYKSVGLIFGITL